MRSMPSPEPKTPHARPDGKGWQWNEEEQCWWRKLESMSVTYEPVTPRNTNGNVIGPTRIRQVTRRVQYINDGVIHSVQHPPTFFQGIPMVQGLQCGPRG